MQNMVSPPNLASIISQYINVLRSHFTLTAAAWVSRDRARIYRKKKEDSVH